MKFRKIGIVGTGYIVIPDFFDSTIEDFGTPSVSVSMLFGRNDQQASVDST